MKVFYRAPALWDGRRSALREPDLARAAILLSNSYALGGCSIDGDRRATSYRHGNDQATPVIR